MLVLTVNRRGKTPNHISLKCKICGAKARSEYCFRHKTQKAIKRSYLKRKPKKTPKVVEVGGKKKRSIRSLKSTLWTQVSKHTRLRDSDDRGIGKCIYCRCEVYWKFADAAHFKKAKYNSTWIQEENRNISCKTCNEVKDHWNNEAEKTYRINLDKKWGPGKAAELDALSKVTKRYSVPELEELIVYYTGEVNRMLKLKNLRA